MVVLGTYAKLLGLLVGGRVDVRNATIAPGENDDTFMVNDVRFKGLAEGDAERWLACLGAAKRGASRSDVARIWAPVDEERDVRGGSSGGALVVALVSCVVVLRPSILIVVLRYVLLPLLLILVNAYVFRRALVRLATRKMPLRRPPSLDLAVRGAALQVTLTDIVYEDPALLDDDSDDEDDDDEAQKDPLLALETIVVSIVVRRVGKSRRLRAEVSAEVTGLTLCYATYDARFRDTNLKRFRGEADEEFDEEETPPPATKPRSLVYRGVHFRNLAVRLVARSPFGARHLGTIKLRDETADLEKNFKSRIQTFAWIQGLAVRAVANVGFDVMDAAFSGAASAVTGLVFAPLDVADRVAERFGGSRSS